MELPARIGKYLLEEFLDDGEAEAYRARDTETGRMVVVKILAQSACADAEARERFLEEAEECEHGEDDSGRPFLVTQPRPRRRCGSWRGSRRRGRARGRWGWMAAIPVAAALLAGAAFHYWPRKKVAAPALGIDPRRAVGRYGSGAGGELPVRRGQRR